MPLLTERLAIRPPEPDDVDLLASLFTDPEAMRYIGPGGTWDDDRMASSLTRKIDLYHERGFTLYTVVRRADGHVLGDCGFNIWPGTGEIEIGWRFAREHWGRGYASEAARSVFEHARDRLDLTHLICMVAADNVASWRIAERLGFTLDRTEEIHGRTVRRYVWDA